MVTLLVRNFMSIGEIKAGLDRPGLNLVLGKNLDDKRFDSNGSAKSALFEAMTWGLYGKFLRDIPVDDVVRTGEKELTVSVTVDPEDGTGIVSITRVRKNKATEVTVLNSVGTPLFPSDSVKDIQKYIDNWLGIDFRTFTNSVYFGKGLSKFFMSSSDAERKELLDTILQMVSFDKALDTSKETLKEIEEKIDSNKVTIAVKESLKAEKERLLEKESEYLTLAEAEYLKMPVLQEEYDLAVKKIETKKTEKVAIKKDIEALDLTRQKELNDNHKEFIASTREINASSPIMQATLDREYKAKALVIQEELKFATSELVSALGTFDSTYNSANSERIEIQKSTYSLKAQVATKEKEYNKFNNVDASVPCLHCKQIVNKEHKEAILDLIKKEMIAIKDAITENNIREEKLELTLKAITDTKHTISNKKLALEAAATEKINALNAEKAIKVKELSREIANKLTALEEAYHAKTHPIVCAIEEKKQKLATALTSIDNEILSSSLDSVYMKKRLDAMVDSFARQQKLVTDLTLALDDLSVQIVDKEQDNALLYKEATRTSFWVEAFGSQGIKSFVFENALPYITERSNYYSTSITGGTVVIDISPTTKYKTKAGFQEKLSVSAVNKHGANIYPGNSDGERRRIDICILLALQDLIATRASKVWNTVVFDEIFDALDRTGIEHVIDLFRSFTDKSIFIISHSEDIKKYFDTAVIVEKKDGVSSLREL